MINTQISALVLASLKKKEDKNAFRELASYEKVTYDLLDKLYQYNCIWSPFTNWLSVTSGAEE